MSHEMEWNGTEGVYENKKKLVYSRWDKVNYCGC